MEIRMPEINLRSVLMASIAVLCLYGCDESSSSESVADAAVTEADATLVIDGGQEADGGDRADQGVAADIPAPGEWIQVEPGGDTLCSRGTPFRFFVRGGRTDRVIVDFRGGGACWNDLTCSIAGSIFAEAVDDFETLRSYAESGLLGGVFDTSEDSLFKDWTIVHIPYCTGDVHWGNAVHEYSDGNNVIHHKGYLNASAALQWLYDRYLTPENVLVSGCSAGAYGAIMHSAYVANHYLDAKVAVLADSGAGIITDNFLTDSLPNWGAQQNIPPFIEELQVPINELELADLYKAIGAYFPQHRFAQTSTAFDADQIFYFEAMGGDRHEWSPRFEASLQRIEEETPNFRAFVPPGPVHCVTPYSFFKIRDVNGTKLTDWVSDLIFADEMPDSVKCQGEECYDDPVCASCAENGGIWCGFCRGWPDEFRPPMDEEQPEMPSMPEDGGQ
jgi:hypothetical protein